jgi:hypothetical protein
MPMIRAAYAAFTRSERFEPQHFPTLLAIVHGEVEADGAALEVLFTAQGRSAY